ncbi:hypothetical protein CAI21_19265 [Alkalilimnicola ehrlichii]|uniref:3-oxoacyl-ACP synthase n=2 Tax=Alkalilimnicola ehrlichii TaxID=351052 RepID=A0A3E0WK88_9GAMM|nr:hypothetical protein CAI21_19265 [Alkalilimnicola ehrlichii]RFA32551.1 hypothetical protein CAL65_19530 [Alkalilimnicola ehrlichii]
MIRLKDNKHGFAIDHIATCDFDRLVSVDNASILAASGHANRKRLTNFIEREMGIVHRYHCPAEKDALDLARDALCKLLELAPELREEADFVIYAGISNPLPVSTHSALLAHEFEFSGKPSCWDIKSGCSSGVLALIQAAQYMSMGARRGVLIASETLSKFNNPNALQMTAAVGDGAVALDLRASSQWLIKSIVHGTDPRFAKGMQVPGKYPYPSSTLEPDQYHFHFEEKAQGLQTLAGYWQSSLRDLLELAELDGADIAYYIAHQIDGRKNRAFAHACGIPDHAIASNFRRYGNMGCPTVFINQYAWQQAPSFSPAAGEHWIWHAVGGGFSWAGLCMQYTG